MSSAALRWLAWSMCVATRAKLPLSSAKRLGWKPQQTCKWRRQWFSTGGVSQAVEGVLRRPNSTPHDVFLVYLQTVSEHPRGLDWDYGLLNKLASRMLPYVSLPQFSSASGDRSHVVALLQSLAESEHMHRKLIQLVLGAVRTQLAASSYSPDERVAISLALVRLTWRLDVRCADGEAQFIWWREEAQGARELVVAMLSRTLVVLQDSSSALHDGNAVFDLLNALFQVHMEATEKIDEGTCDQAECLFLGDVLVLDTITTCVRFLLHSCRLHVGEDEAESREGKLNVRLTGDKVAALAILVASCSSRGPHSSRFLPSPMLFDVILTRGMRDALFATVMAALKEEVRVVSEHRPMPSRLARQHRVDLLFAASLMVRRAAHVESRVQLLLQEIIGERQESGAARMTLGEASRLMTAISILHSTPDVEIALGDDWISLLCEDAMFHVDRIDASAPAPAMRDASSFLAALSEYPAAELDLIVAMFDYCAESVMFRNRRVLMPHSQLHGGKHMEGPPQNAVSVVQQLSNIARLALAMQKMASNSNHFFSKTQTRSMWRLIEFAYNGWFELATSSSSSSSRVRLTTQLKPFVFSASVALFEAYKGARYRPINGHAEIHAFCAEQVVRVRSTWNALRTERGKTRSETALHMEAMQIEQISGACALFDCYAFLVLPCAKLRGALAAALVDMRPFSLVQQQGFLSRWNFTPHHRMRLLLLARNFATWEDAEPKFWNMFESCLRDWLDAFKRDPKCNATRVIIPNLYYAEQALFFLCKHWKTVRKHSDAMATQASNEMGELSALLLRLKDIRLQAEKSPQGVFEMSKEPTVSESQSLMYEALQDLVESKKIGQFYAEYDACTEDKDTRGLGLFFIDAAIPSMKMAIEFEGPYHYCTHHTFVGPALLRRKQLMQIGWHVVHVPWFDFRRASDRKARCVYLESLIQAATAEQVENALL